MISKIIIPFFFFGTVFSAPCPSDCSKSSSFEKNKPSLTPPDLNRVINPSVTPLSCSKYGEVRLLLDFIYWKRNSFLPPFIVNGFGFSEGDLNVPVQGSSFTPSEGYQPGFKVGIGWDFKENGWDLIAFYTWIQDTGKVNFKRDPDKVGSIAEIFTQNNNVNGIEIDSAEGSPELTFHLIQLELGRDFYTSQYLSLRPKIGIACLYMPSSYTSTLLGIPDDYKIQNFNAQSQSTGAGLFAGFDTNWFFTEEWSFLGKYALFSLLMHLSSHTQSTYSNISSAPIKILNAKGSFDYMEPFVNNLFLGLMWQRIFSSDTRLSLSAGWEFFFNLHEYFVEQNSLMSPPTQLSFQGLTLDAKFDF